MRRVELERNLPARVRFTLGLTLRAITPTQRPRDDSWTDRYGSRGILRGLALSKRSTLATSALAIVEKSSYPTGGTEFGEKLKSYAERNVSTTREFVKQLSHAKDFQEMVAFCRC
jgi:hypothetical protein